MRNHFYLLEISDSCHSQEVRNQVDHDSQVDEYVELLKQGRAHGGESHDDLDSYQSTDSCIWRTETVYSGKELREESDGGSFSSYFRNGELPSGQGYEAGADEHAGNDVACGWSEHGSVCKAERSIGIHQFSVRNEAADDSGGSGVASACEQCACKNSDRNILFRIFNSVGVSACSFKTKESPEDDCDGFRRKEDLPGSKPVHRRQG